MSEEIALASADMEHVARLQELVNHWCIAARDLDAALQRAEREIEAEQAVIRTARAVARGEPGRVDLHVALARALAAYDRRGER